MGSQVKAIRDDEGEIVLDGDLVRFAYGIPPVGVEARIVERKGKLIALTPGHTPHEYPLARLRSCVGGFCKVMPKANEVGEVEAALFRSRAAKEGK